MAISHHQWAIHCIVQPEANTWPFSVLQEPFIIQPEVNTWSFFVLQEPFTVSYNQRLIFRPPRAFHYHTTRGKYMTIFHPLWVFHCIMQPDASNNTLPFSVLYEHFTVSYNQRLIHDHFPSSKSLSLYHTTRVKYMTIFRPLWVFHCIMQPDANSNTWPFSILYELFTVSCKQRLIDDNFPSSVSLSLYHRTWG